MGKENVVLSGRKVFGSAFNSFHFAGLQLTVALTLALPFPLELSRSRRVAPENCINCANAATHQVFGGCRCCCRRCCCLRLICNFSAHTHTYQWQPAPCLPVLRHFEIFVASNAVVNLIKCHAKSNRGSVADANRAADRAVAENDGSGKLEIARRLYRMKRLRHGTRNGASTCIPHWP